MNTLRFPPVAQRPVIQRSFVLLMLQTALVGLVVTIASLVSLAAAYSQTLHVLAPNGGEHFVTGTATTVRWEESNVNDEIEIEYTVDGSQWRRIGRVNSGVKQITWTPTRESQAARVRVTTKREMATDMSDGTFVITLDPLEATLMLAPNGGEIVNEGDVYPVRFQVPPDAVEALIELSTNSGGTWSQLATVKSPTALYNWSVPHLSDLPITTAMMRVSVAEAPDHFDVSDAVFAITPRVVTKSLHVLSPNGGEVYRVDSAITVKWSSEGLSGEQNQARVEYSVDAGLSWSEIATEDVAKGQHTWTVPNRPTTKALVRIVMQNGSAGDTSDLTFTILDKQTPPSPNPTKLHVIVPSGDELWQTYEKQSIGWSFDGNPDQDLRLELIISEPAQQVLYIDNIRLGAGYYPWTVMNLGSGSHTAQVLLTLEDDITVTDTSKPFTLSRGSAPASSVGMSGKASRLQVYPNPAASLVRVTMPSSIGHVAIYDRIGAEVLRTTSSQGVAELNVHALPAGTYTVVVMSEGLPACLEKLTILR